MVPLSHHSFLGVLKQPHVVHSGFYCVVLFHESTMASTRVYQTLAKPVNRLLVAVVFWQVPESLYRKSLNAVCPVLHILILLLGCLCKFGLSRGL